MPSRGPTSVTVAIRRARCSTASPATPPLFLDLDQGLGPLGPLAPPRGLPLEVGDPPVSRVHDPRRRPALLRRRPGQLPALARRTPRREVRGVQTLTAQQRADGPRGLTGVGLADDLPLVLHREASPPGLGRHFDLLSVQALLECAHRPPILARSRH